MPESDGFLLAGGAALENAAAKRGWAIRRIHDSDTFCRLMIAGADNLLVDLALDSPPNLPPAASLAGPTFGLEELAGRKLLALFDRAEARDFADIFVLAKRYPVDLILESAAQVDAGFDPTILATMLGTLARFDDSDIPVTANVVAELRRFFHDWQQRLLAGSARENPA